MKYLHDSLNIVTILAPALEFFSAKCDQFPITFAESNQMMVILPPEMLSFIFETNLIKR